MGRNAAIGAGLKHFVDRAVVGFNEFKRVLPVVMAVGAGAAAAISAEVATIGAATKGSRYMSAGEAATVQRTGSIPATNAQNQPRVIHFTTDRPTYSAGDAASKYQLPTVPTHVVHFPASAVQNNVAPAGRVAADATQAATSLPINSAGRPIPLDP